MALGVGFDLIFAYACISQGSQLAGIQGEPGIGRIPPKCTLTKFDMGNAAQGIPPYIPAFFLYLRFVRLSKLVRSSLRNVGRSKAVRSTPMQISASHLRDTQAKWMRSVAWLRPSLYRGSKPVEKVVTLEVLPGQTRKNRLLPWIASAFCHVFSIPRFFNVQAEKHEKELSWICSLFSTSNLKKDEKEPAKSETPVTWIWIGSIWPSGRIEVWSSRATTTSLGRGRQIGMPLWGRWRSGGSSWYPRSSFLNFGG